MKKIVIWIVAIMFFIGVMPALAAQAPGPNQKALHNANENAKLAAKQAAAEKKKAEIEAKKLQKKAQIEAKKKEIELKKKQKEMEVAAKKQQKEMKKQAAGFKLQ